MPTYLFTVLLFRSRSRHDWNFLLGHHKTESKWWLSWIFVWRLSRKALFWAYSCWWIQESLRSFISLAGCQLEFGYQLLETIPIPCHVAYSSFKPTMVCWITPMLPVFDFHLCFWRTYVVRLGSYGQSPLLKVNCAI